MKLAIAFLLLSTSTAFACPEGCEPPPPPPPHIKPTPLPTPPRDRGGDGHKDHEEPAVSQPKYMPCCVRDGVVLWHAPLNLDREGTRDFCAAQPLASIPSCKVWVAK